MSYPSFDSTDIAFESEDEEFFQTDDSNSDYYEVCMILLYMYTYIRVMHDGHL